MSVLEVLSQAHLLDLRIRIRLEQLDSLNSLAVKATSTYGNDPVSGTRDVHKREDIICKIVDLQNEINAEIDRLVDMKREIKIMIEAVPFVDGRTILEMRYVNLCKWEEIAVGMHYALRSVHYIHDKAVQYLEEKYASALTESE
jgi:hypothetical protein